MITNLIKPLIGKPILNHLIGSNCPEFGSGLLDSYFFKLDLKSDCLELFSGQSLLKPSWLSVILVILSFEPRFSMFIINGYCTKANACSPRTPCIFWLFINKVFLQIYCTLFPICTYRLQSPNFPDKSITLIASHK